MTDDERALLLAVAKVMYAQASGKLIVRSDTPMLNAIKKLDPDFESELIEHPKYEETFFDTRMPIIIGAACLGVIALVVIWFRFIHQ